MKLLSMMIVAVICMQKTDAQLKTSAICPAFTADILEGTVNDVYTFSQPGSIQQKFPCFTNIIEESNGSTCGGVFYKDKDISFFTERDYIEIGHQFKGKLIPQVMGASRTSLFNVLGNPTIKDINWDAFKTKYGVLVLYYNKTGRINKIQMSNKSAENLKLCE